MSRKSIKSKGEITTGPLVVSIIIALVTLLGANIPAGEIQRLGPAEFEVIKTAEAKDSPVREEPARKGMEFARVELSIHKITGEFSSKR